MVGVFHRALRAVQTLNFSVNLIPKHRTKLCVLQFRKFSDEASSPLDKIQDVTGGKINEETPEEGKLFLAERAKNLVFANRRFQLSTYTRLPEDLNDAESVYTSLKHPVYGVMHKASNKPVIFLRKDHESDKQHILNVSKLANASLLTGHIDPPPLIPVFTRVGLKPPTVLMVGDLLEVESESEVENLIPDDLKNQDVKPYWFEWSSVHYVDLFDDRRVVKARDFRAGFVDSLAESQHKVIDLVNTKYFDFLPSFCKGFLGVPVDDAYFYSVDRAGMSIFALRADTDDHWREYRFPFAREIKSVMELEALFKTMLMELLEAEKAQKDAAAKQGDAGGKAPK